MVDAIVSSAVQRLGDFLIQEKGILQDVADKVKKLRAELGSMQCFIEDAERKQDDTQIRQWIADLRDVAYKVEDVIDDFVLKVRVEEGDLPDIGEEIEALKNAVDDIFVRKEANGIIDIRKDGKQMDGATGNLGQRRRTFSLEDEDKHGQRRRTFSLEDEDNHVVGFEKVADSLVEDQLLKDDPLRCVISIVGMGGLGKTTLARKLYHHSKIEDNFHDHRAWVCVTKNYRFRDLLQTIAESLQLPSNETRKKNEQELRQYLDGILNECRYLVVIDDIWHKVDWYRLSSVFPNNNKGSRVIITTRNKEVAACADERTCVHRLEKLDKGAAWKLFCMKVFPDESCCPPDLETSGKRMVEKCDGLPLAIIVLGGLLNNTLPEEWPRVEKSMWQHLRDYSLDIDPLLSLSFNDLPNQMKLCFLYFGLFPEDFVIDTQKLIHLWVAEGFIPPEKNETQIDKHKLISSWIFEGQISEKNKTMEALAGDFLNELISRNFVQVAKRNWRRITACRVHDLLRDLAVKMAKGLNFLHIHEHNNDSTPSFSIESSYRRQATYSRIGRKVSFDNSNPFLRTLLCFIRVCGQCTIWLESIQKNFRLLRVLDLQDIRFYYCTTEGIMLEAIVGLIHLRYLGLRNTDIQELPSSIFNLQALQTLDVLNSYTVRLLGDICKLKQLRHLIGDFGENLRVDGLTNLQTLVYISMRAWINTDPVSLINLRELRVVPSNQRVNQIEFTLDTVGELLNLQSLSVRLSSSMCFSSFEPLSNCCFLVQLMLYGKIEKLPEQMHYYLPILEYLQLRQSDLSEDPMPALEKLPELKILELRSNNFKKLTATANGFRRLEVLRLLELRNLKEFQLDDGTMPRLKGVTIYQCNQLTPIPEKLKLTPNAMNLNWDWSDRYT